MKLISIYKNYLIAKWMKDVKENRIDRGCMKMYCLLFASYCCGVMGFFLSFGLEAVFAPTSELQIAFLLQGGHLPHFFTSNISKTHRLFIFFLFYCG